MKTGKINKSIGIIVMVAILLIGTIYLNINESNKAVNAGNNDSDLQSELPANNILDSEDALESSSVSGTDYFEAFREYRESVRENEIEYLDAIIADEKTDAETLAEAQRQKLEMVEIMEAEFTIENLILAKGFKNVAVSFHKGSVNVIIDAETLTQEQVAQVLDIVITQAGVNAENVKVGVKQ